MLIKEFYDKLGEVVSTGEIDHKANCQFMKEATRLFLDKNKEKVRLYNESLELLKDAILALHENMYIWPKKSVYITFSKHCEKVELDYDRKSIDAPMVIMDALLYSLDLMSVNTFEAYESHKGYTDFKSYRLTYKDAIRNTIHDVQRNGENAKEVIRESFEYHVRVLSINEDVAGYASTLLTDAYMHLLKGRLSVVFSKEMYTVCGVALVFDRPTDMAYLSILPTMISQQGLHVLMRHIFQLSQADKDSPYGLPTDFKLKCLEAMV